ncbi:MAG: two-component regulator propeller domain-containing protein, partial [Bacteroidota bacterium]
GGLCRYDGKRFEIFTQRQGLINNYISALHEDQAGNLWIGTDVGISRYDGKRFDNIRLDTTLIVRAITTDWDNNIWLGTNRGLYVSADTGFRYLQTESFPQENIRTLFKDQNQHVWIGFDGGAIEVTPSRINRYGREEGFRRQQVQAFAQDTDGVIWAAVYGGGLYKKTEGGFERQSRRGNLGGGFLFDLHFDQKGHLWMASQNAGLEIWDPRTNTANVLDEDDGLANNYVRVIQEDRWGNLYFATSGGGVSKYFGQQFTHYDRNFGLNGRSVYSVLEDQNCRIWMGVAGRGVSMYDGQNFTHFDRRNGFLDVKVKSIFEDADGHIWIGTEGEGVFVCRDSSFTPYAIADGLGGNYIREILQDPKDGSMLFASTGGGITRMYWDPDSIPDKEKDFVYYATRTGMPQNQVNDIHIDRKGRLWYASASRGIGMITEDSIYQILFPENRAVNSVRSMTEDGHGNLWIGAAGGLRKVDLYAYPDTLISTLYSEELTSSNVYLLEIDEWNNLWIGSEKGVDRATLDLNQDIIEWKHFGRSEGFVGVEVCQNAVERDRDGHMWFGTINGLTEYNPASFSENPIAPILHLTDIKLFYESIHTTKYADRLDKWNAVNQSLSFPFRQNHLEFEFVGINHKDPENVRYQWQLVGQEDNWSPPSFRSNATFSNLSPGEYTFKVRAMNEDGKWSESISVPVVIHPPFWQTWWFLLACAIFLLGIVWLIFRLRINQVKRKASEKERQLEMEKELLKLEQKALSLQMNPHFIFNALNSIQALIAANDNQKARYYLAKFARLMRSVLENSREAMVPLSDEIDSLDTYLSLEKFSRNSAFDYEIALDPWIEKEDVFIPPLLIQPFVENAIIHGVAHKTDAGEIKLQFSLSDNKIECVIADNGIGRAKAADIKAQQAQHHKSAGLQVTQERLDILNHGDGNGKSIEFVDLTDPAGQASGTQVLVRLPVRVNGNGQH